MTEVRVTIGPKSYAIACGPGEEERIARLGEMIDAHYARLGQARATSEAQNLVFAALFMADALSEANDEIDRLRTAGGDRAASAPDPIALAEQLEALAAEAERTADTLDARGRTP